MEHFRGHEPSVEPHRAAPGHLVGSDAGQHRDVGGPDRPAVGDHSQGQGGAVQSHPSLEAGGGVRTRAAGRIGVENLPPRHGLLAPGLAEHEVVAQVEHHRA